MKCADEYVGTKADLLQYLKTLTGQIQGNTLSVQAQAVPLPGDSDLMYKIKFAEDEEECQLAIKITWPKVVEG